jgi:ubiquinone/menaquinone biosynthesis C-methylase UbiE
MRQWQDLLSTHVGGTTISLVVDLGCGTGRFSELLAAHFGAQVIGIDPSQKMLDRARQKLTNSGIVFQQSSAEALPLADGCVDFVFMSQVYHHLVRPIDVAWECWRVLREGGYICLRNTTREVDFVYRHFVQTMRPLIDSELPGRQEIARLFVSAGFAHAVHQIVTHVVARDWPSFVQKSALRGDSFLARLPTEECNAGMAKLRARAAISNPDDVVSEEIDWFVFIKAGSPTTRHQHHP